MTNNILDILPPNPTHNKPPQNLNADQNPLPCCSHPKNEFSGLLWGERRCSSNQFHFFCVTNINHTVDHTAVTRIQCTSLEFHSHWSTIFVHHGPMATFLWRNPAAICSSSTMAKLASRLAPQRIKKDSTRSAWADRENPPVSSNPDTK